MEEAYHRRGYETVEAAVGGGQPRGQALWGRRTLRSGARRTESTNATRDRNLLVITDCSNAFGAVERPAVLAEVASFVPALTPFVAKCYGTRPVGVFFRLVSGEPERSLAQAVFNKETPWGRQCSVLLCVQG